jgi:hypothetical protein
MFYVNSSSTIQIIDTDANLSNTTKYDLSNLQIDVSLSASLKLTANVVSTVQATSFAKLTFLLIKSTGTFDLALKSESGEPLFLGLPTKYHLLINPDGQAFEFIKLKSASNNLIVEVVAGGLI